MDRDVGRLGPQQLYERFAHETKPRLKLLAPVLGRLESLHETVERMIAGSLKAKLRSLRVAMVPTARVKAVELECLDFDGASSEPERLAMSEGMPERAPRIPGARSPQGHREEQRTKLFRAQIVEGDSKSEREARGKEMDGLVLAPLSSAEDAAGSRVVAGGIDVPVMPVHLAPAQGSFLFPVERKPFVQLSLERGGPTLLSRILELRPRLQVKTGSGRLGLGENR